MTRDIQIIDLAAQMGDRVVCDSCSKEFTDLPDSGGIYGFGSKAIGPCCVADWEASAKRYHEEHHIKARCPEGKSFAEWVREDLR